MRFGVGFFATDETVDPAVLGRLVEERGLSSIFLTEHTHIPLDHSPYPGGGDLPVFYKRTLDPFVALAAIAAVTTKVRLGFGISLITQRDPITTAKAVASLDWISNGRVDFGVGAGWNEPELQNHGVPFDRRFKVMRERVEAMRELWTEDEASYDGEFVSFGPTWSWPKPVQDPLPVYVGGNGPRVLERVVRYGNGWMPNLEDDLAERIAELRSLADDHGRERPDVTYFGVPLRPEPVERLWEAGVDQVLFMIRTGPRATVEDCLDRAAAVAAYFE